MELIYSPLLVTYMHPNVVVPASVFSLPPPTLPPTTEAAVMDGGAAALQAAVLLPPSTQPVLVSREPTPPTTQLIRQEVTIEQLIDFLNGYGWHKVRMSDHLRSNPTVSAAMHAAGIVAPTGDEAGTEVSREAAESPVEKRFDIVVVDDKFYFVPLNLQSSRFIKFQSKVDYIRHHM